MKEEPIVKGTTFHVLDQDMNDIEKPRAAAAHALVRAQSFAERTPEAQTYYVQRRTLFGNPTDLYSVERGEDGIVRTFTLTLED